MNTNFTFICTIMYGRIIVMHKFNGENMFLIENRPHFQHISDNLSSKKQFENVQMKNVLKSGPFPVLIAIKMLTTSFIRFMFMTHAWLLYTSIGTVATQLLHHHRHPNQFQSTLNGHFMHGNHFNTHFIRRLNELINKYFVSFDVVRQFSRRQHLIYT